MSRVAGSPTPVKEAMACGAIPICTKYGTTDFILSDFNGYVVPVDEVENIVNLITLLADNYDKRMHIAANAVDTMKRYEWQVIADQFIYAILEGQKRGDALLKERDWYIQR
jgi:glycosyltransferase involved in cell wall biosynthesis